MKLTKDEFEIIRGFINEKIGLVLDDDKEYLVQQRLEPIATEYKCATFWELYWKLKSEESHVLLNKVIAAITTNETSFFRDSHPFDTFRDYIFPHLYAKALERKKQTFTRRGPKVNIWCAASSTGQEPYTLAMIIAEAVFQQNQKKHEGVVKEDFGIMASDISTEVLAKAMTGRYDQLEIGRGIPPYYLQRYFDRDGKDWVIKDDIQQLVEFKRVNLIEPFNFIGSFEVIFCRNVLIYFDSNTRGKILDQFYNMVNPGGFLMLGASENMIGVSNKFHSEHVKQTILYTKK